MKSFIILVATTLITLTAIDALACPVETCVVEDAEYACDIVCNSERECEQIGTHARCDQCGADDLCVICSFNPDRGVIVNGTSGNDVICGSVNNDVLNGRGGNDVIRGDAGDDIIDGGRGHDEVHGDEGDDVVSGGRGHDLVVGGPGSDHLDGGAGDDELCSTTGHRPRVASNDMLASRLCGGPGNDVLRSDGPGHQCLDGGGGFDECEYEDGGHLTPSVGTGTQQCEGRTNLHPTRRPACGCP